MAAALYLKAPLQRSVPARTASSTGAGGSGAGKVTNMATASARLPTNTDASAPPQITTPRVVAGGVGAGKSASAISVKPTSNPGMLAEVLEAAQSGLPFFLGQIPPGSKELYGFSANDDLSRARLGPGLQMHAITPRVLKQASAASNISSLLSETGMWFFPVLIESESKAMLVVDRVDSSWKAVSLGYAALGHELNDVLAQWPESKGFHPQLIAVFQAKQFYFAVPEMGDFNLTPITLSPGGFSNSGTRSGNNYTELAKAAESLQELKPIVLKAELYQAR
ncbi:MAG TPA: hypothetical protein VL361_28450 [Candidatus Limnocylindrales bacterium]|nr:hypothetical protein [Candidatus Limnocylindrales bacterium]